MGARRHRRSGRRDLLSAALGDSDEPTRAQAAWALGAIDDRSAVPALIRALGDQAERVRKQAAWALGAIDDSRAVDALVKALSDQSQGVRQQAAWALGAIGDSRALPGLLPVAQGHRRGREKAGRMGDWGDRTSEGRSMLGGLRYAVRSFRKRPG